MDIDHDRDSDTATTPKRRSTPRRSPGISVTLENDGDVGSPLTALSDENSEHESEEDGEVSSTKIPKPPGEAGRPQSGGYNLQDKLGWNDKTYESVMVSMSVKAYMKDSDRKLQALVHKMAKTKLNITKSFRGQDKKVIKQICDAVSYSTIHHRQN